MSKSRISTRKDKYSNLLNKLVSTLVKWNIGCKMSSYIRSAFLYPDVGLTQMRSFFGREGSVEQFKNVMNDYLTNSKIPYLTLLLSGENIGRKAD